jgi:sulfur carrier protein ThiS
VHAGAFTVNGKTINVSANDSIRSVLAKITDSSAGVIASIDQATQSVKLTAKSLAAAPITLGNDTSGFLSAVKLDSSARSVAGSDPTPSIDAVLAQMSEYAKVHAGTLSVNGAQIQIDPTSTTIAGLVAQLNRIDGVNASLDQASGRVSLAAKPHSSPLRITDTSGVLTSLGITAGSRRIVHPSQPSDQTNANAVAAQVAAGANAIGSLLSNYQIGGASTEAALRSAAEFLAAAGAKGVSVSGGPASPRLTVDQDQLSASLAANGRAFANRFSQPGGTSAVLAELLQRFAKSASAAAHAPTSALTDAVKASFLSAQG